MIDQGVSTFFQHITSEPLVTEQIKYSDRKVSTLSEYVFIFVLLCIIQKLCVDKKWIPPGLSIEFLR